MDRLTAEGAGQDEAQLAISGSVPPIYSRYELTIDGPRVTRRYVSYTAAGDSQLFAVGLSQYINCDIDITTPFPSPKKYLNTTAKP